MLCISRYNQSWLGFWSVLYIQGGPKKFMNLSRGKVFEKF